MWGIYTWYWVTDTPAASNDQCPLSKWIQFPALWARLPVELGDLCLIRGQLTRFSAWFDVFLLLRISKISLKPVWFHWVSSKGMAIIAKWLFQVQGSMNDFFKHSDSTQSACHGVWATWHNWRLSPPSFFQGLPAVMWLPSVCPHYLYHGELTTTSLAQLLEVGIIN